MVLDNHKAHDCRATRDLAHELGCHLEFLPPTASELNPIERMWAYFKREWRQTLYDPINKITNFNSKDFIKKTLYAIRKTGVIALRKGPRTQILKLCKPLDPANSDDELVGDFMA